MQAHVRDAFTGREICDPQRLHYGLSIVIDYSYCTTLLRRLRLVDNIELH